MKMVWETHRILDPNIEIGASCVRVPVVNGHSESIHIETREPITIDSVKNCLREAKGVKLISGEGSESYISPDEAKGMTKEELEKEIYGFNPYDFGTGYSGKNLRTIQIILDELISRLGDD